MNVPKGVSLLREYLSTNGLKLTPWCAAKGLPRVSLTRVFSGYQQSLSLESAHKVERATNGAVPVASWAEVAS